MSGDVPLRDAAQALLDALNFERRVLMEAPLGTPQRRQFKALYAASPWVRTEVEALRAALAAADTAPELKPLAYARFVERERPAPGPERVVLHAYTGQENLHIDGEYALYRRTERLAAADGTTPTQPDEAPPDLGHAIFVERRDPDGSWSPVVRFVDHEAPRVGTIEYRVVPSPPGTEPER